MEGVQDLPALIYVAEGTFSAAELWAFLAACFFPIFLAGVVTGAAAGAAATAAAGAGIAAGAGVAANVTAEPNRPAATNRAVRLDFIMMDPKSNDPWVGFCHVGLEPTEGDFTEANLG